ncbi:MAG: hypothetical protein V7K69_13010 [Nostoc sp.]|uniref:hypothetical protein n=1 Tax=Nostoc sp. TaxID=1180 RepID=UPI002FF50744
MKYLFAIPLITAMFGVTMSSQVWAVSLYNAGGLKTGFGEISKNFTAKYDIPYTSVCPLWLATGTYRARTFIKKASADVYGLKKR